MKPRVLQTRAAGAGFAVVTVVGGSTYQRVPCAECPWRVDQTGKFPAEAFRISASTSYDAAHNAFACHMAGKDHPSTCAGFLLRNADNNIGVRLAIITRKINPSLVHDGGYELHASYRAMAIANGVQPKDPALKLCRGNGQPAFGPRAGRNVY